MYLLQQKTRAQCYQLQTTLSQNNLFTINMVCSRYTGGIKQILKITKSQEKAKKVTNESHLRRNILRRK